MKNRQVLSSILLGFAFCASALVVLWLCRIDEDPFTIQLWVPNDLQTNQLIQELDSLQSSYHPSATGRQITETYIRINLIRFGYIRGSSEELDWLEHRLRERTNQFISHFGVDQYVGLGANLANQVTQALSKIEESVKCGQTRWSDWVIQHKDSDLVRTVRGLGGGLLERALASQLIPECGRIPSANKLVLRYLWLARWMILAGLNPDDHFSTAAKRLLIAWKVDAAAHLGKSRKLELLRQLTKLDASFPYCFELGKIEAQFGEYSAARHAFISCIEQGVMPEESLHAVYILKWQLML